MSHLAPRDPASGNIDEAIRQLINIGYGYSILPRAAVQQEIRNGLFQIGRFEEPGIFRQLVVVTCAHRIPASGLSELIRLIKKVFAETANLEAPGDRPQPAPLLRLSAS